MNDSFLLALLLVIHFALGYSIGRLHGTAQAFSFVRKHLLKDYD